MNTTLKDGYACLGSCPDLRCVCLKRVRALISCVRSLERFVLEQKLKGPCWLQIDEPSKYNSRLWLGMCCVGDGVRLRSDVDLLSSSQWHVVQSVVVRFKNVFTKIYKALIYHSTLAGHAWELSAPGVASHPDNSCFPCDICTL